LYWLAGVSLNITEGFLGVKSELYQAALNLIYDFVGVGHGVRTEKFACNDGETRLVGLFGFSNLAIQAEGNFGSNPHQNRVSRITDFAKVIPING
jgi:hypothetical protein